MEGGREREREEREREREERENCDHSLTEDRLSPIVAPQPTYRQK